MIEVKRFTRTCDCITEVPHGEYVLYLDFDAEHALRLQAEKELANWKIKACENSERADAAEKRGDYWQEAHDLSATRLIDAEQRAIELKAAARYLPEIAEALGDPTLSNYNQVATGIRDLQELRLEAERQVGELRGQFETAGENLIKIFNGLDAEREDLKAKLDTAMALLGNLVKDSMASDFNEHWDSFEAAETYINTTSTEGK